MNIRNGLSQQLHVSLSRPMENTPFNSIFREWKQQLADFR